MAVFKDKTARPRTADASGRDLNALLGAGTEFEGTLRFEGMVRIDCKFKGEIISDDVLVIGEHAHVEAEINVGAAVLMGTLHGNVTAREAIEIQSTGKIYGQLETPSIKIDEGAVFEGQCNMQKRSPDAGNVTPISAGSAAATPGSIPSS